MFDLACGLPKYMGQVVRQRTSSPKLEVFNNVLMGMAQYRQENQEGQRGRWLIGSDLTHGWRLMASRAS